MTGISAHVRKLDHIWIAAAAMPAAVGVALQLYKTEKTHFGTLVEIDLQRR